MKAEERKHLQQNELETRLKTAWSGVSGNSPTATRVWAVVLGLLIMVLAWVIWSRFRTDAQSMLWSKLDFASDLPSLEKIVKDHASSTQATIARFHIARVKGVDAMSQVATNVPDDRVAAAAALEDVRKTYTELISAGSLPVEMHQETLSQLGHLEEVLASVPKADDANAMRGSLDEALKRYDELKSKYPESFAGIHAIKRAEDIRAHRAEIDKLNAALAQDHAKAPPPQAPLNVTPATPNPTPLPPDLPK